MMSLQNRLLLALPALLVWSLLVTARERLGPRPIMPRLRPTTGTPHSWSWALSPSPETPPDPKTLN